jgi:hypothetical protein
MVDLTIWLLFYTTHVSLWPIQLTTSPVTHLSPPGQYNLVQDLKTLTVNVIICYLLTDRGCSHKTGFHHTHMSHYNRYNWPRHRPPFITAWSIQSGPRFKTLTINLIIFYLLTALLYQVWLRSWQLKNVNSKYWYQSTCNILNDKSNVVCLSCYTLEETSVSEILSKCKY